MYPKEHFSVLSIIKSLKFPPPCTFSEYSDIGAKHSKVIHSNQIVHICTDYCTDDTKVSSDSYLKIPGWIFIRNAK